MGTTAETAPVANRPRRSRPTSSAGSRASRDDRRYLKAIARRLYSEDLETRYAAAVDLGRAARQHPELLRKCWSRIFSAADDTMSCWGAAEGLGEIARNLPDCRGRILGVLRKFGRDASTCQGYVWALCRISQVDPDRARELLPDMLRFLDSDEPCLLAQTLWALGELHVRSHAPPIRRRADDPRETWIYGRRGVSKTTVGAVARRALEKMAARRD